ncbi:MAG: helix-turn-helix transcriptional regulator [Acidobacteria bacterium]|nr:helix-turn-helix transcriptional regulator [Acidobacteriota bacterium]
MKDLSVPEQLILTAIWRLGKDAYGVTIRRKVAEVTQKDLIYGTLYNFLDQLLRKGYVTKTPSEPTGERGGRSRMIYGITEKGLLALREARALQESIWAGIPAEGLTRQGSSDE